MSLAEEFRAEAAARGIEVPPLSDDDVLRIVGVNLGVRLRPTARRMVIQAVFHLFEFADALMRLKKAGIPVLNRLMENVHGLVAEVNMDGLDGPGGMRGVRSINITPATGPYDLKGPDDTIPVFNEPLVDFLNRTPGGMNLVDDPDESMSSIGERIVGGRFPKKKVASLM